MKKSIQFQKLSVQKSSVVSFSNSNKIGLNENVKITTVGGGGGGGTGDSWRYTCTQTE